MYSTYHSAYHWYGHCPMDNKRPTINKQENSFSSSAVLVNFHFSILVVQSLITPKSQLQQMKWKDDEKTWWDFVGLKLLLNVQVSFRYRNRDVSTKLCGWSGFGMVTVGIRVVKAKRLYRGKRLKG